MTFNNFKMGHFFGAMKIFAVIFVRFAIKYSWI